jgi:hypothetical protein
MAGMRKGRWKKSRTASKQVGSRVYVGYLRRWFRSLNGEKVVSGKWSVSMHEMSQWVYIGPVVAP